MTLSDGSIRHGDNSDYSSGTVVVWKAFGENLKEYCKKDISFEDIDKPFADRFTLYLQKQGYMPNTINKRFLVFANSVTLRLWKGITRMLFPYEFGKTGR